MSWLGKFLGGAFGFLLGGPLGAILGASVGHHFDLGLGNLDRNVRLNAGDQHRVQMAFFTATFSVMGHIAKSDGRVSPAEINLAKQVMDNMKLSGDMRETAINLFQRGKSPDFPLHDVLTQFRTECYRRTNLIRMFLEIQLQAALADGDLNSAEDKLLLNICRHLGIARFEYERLKLQLLAQQRFYRYSSDNQYKPARPAQHRLADAYAILGLSATASDSEIKKAYRRLISQHHPDKLVAKGLPEEMMTLAKEKTQQVRKAYETITEARKR
ncbi:MAG: co-chaperone DjlA [Gammaproteobacteria bacterium]